MAFLFLVSIRYVMYSVAVAREMKIMLYSACESSAELAGAIKRFNWKFGLFVFIPHARDWFDLFVRFTPHTLFHKFQAVWMLHLLISLATC